MRSGDGSDAPWADSRREPARRAIKDRQESLRARVKRIAVKPSLHRLVGPTPTKSGAHWNIPGAGKIALLLFEQRQRFRREQAAGDFDVGERRGLRHSAARDHDLAEPF